ncbi:unnamed protein product [Anisakis simplex]|uniref:FERM domain-containing protein n=1 Tax=Anisakis simplex TaxID=6269 RepID=A0A0M3KH56_ANISI|nr:unnamed protein product [Anisakis simplex]
MLESSSNAQGESCGFSKTVALCHVLKARKADNFQKKMSLHRVEQTGVKVELLNGKNIEVSCRSDAIASEVADVVMRHINFNENSFFGLTTLRDGEHFFLEENQRLEKFAPSGWKNAYHHGVAIRRPYNLYLRFRYYPATTNFIKYVLVIFYYYCVVVRFI